MSNKMRYTYKQIKETKHPLEPASNNYALDYLMHPVLWLVSNFTKLTPNHITTIGFIFGLFSAYFFFTGHLITGGLFYLIRQIMDGVDGRLARIKGPSSKWGAWYENYSGLINLFLNLSALCYGQYLLTSNTLWLILWPVTLFSFQLHNWESMKVAILLKDKFNEKISGSGDKGIVARVKNWLINHKLQDPFCHADGTFLIFIIAPISGFVKEILYFWLIVTFAKAIFWFVYYTKILKAEDKTKQET